MLEQKQTVEFVRTCGDWKAGDRADFSAPRAAQLEEDGFVKIIGSRIRQKAKKRKE